MTTFATLQSGSEDAREQLRSCCVRGLCALGESVTELQTMIIINFNDLLDSLIILEN